MVDCVQKLFKRISHQSWKESAFPILLPSSKLINIILCIKLDREYIRIRAIVSFTHLTLFKPEITARKLYAPSKLNFFFLWDQTTVRTFQNNLYIFIKPILFFFIIYIECHEQVRWMRKKCMPFHEKQVNRKRVSLGQQSQTIFPFPLMWFPTLLIKIEFVEGGPWKVKTKTNKITRLSDWVKIGQAK